uniref:Uncharacterized protein n=1 Tax=Cyanoderma ruficeps TaxID=181631 RepID=A0A8C3NPK3_9PASS
MENEPQSAKQLFLWGRTKPQERLFLVRTLWLYLIIMKFLFFCFSLLEELANGLILVFFFTNSFLSVFPA